MRGRFSLRRLPMLARAVLAWGAPAWVMLASVLATEQAAAQALPPAVVACMDQHDPTQRLVCYDREVPRAVAATRTAAPGSTASASTPAISSAAGSAPAPASQLAGAPGPATRSEVDAFGMTAQIQRKENGSAPPPRLDKLTAHIASVSQKPRGEFIVTLDNGQVWEEAESTSHLPLRAGDGITIKRGMLGAFYMSSQQVPGLRVRRVR